MYRQQNNTNKINISRPQRAINSLEKFEFLEEPRQNATKCPKSKIVLTHWLQRSNAGTMVTLVT